MIFGFDIKTHMHVPCRDCSRSRTLSDTHVAAKTAKAIPSPYVNGLVPAFA